MTRSLQSEDLKERERKCDHLDIEPSSAGDSPEAEGRARMCVVAVRQASSVTLTLAVHAASYECERIMGIVVEVTRPAGGGLMASSFQKKFE